MKFQEVVYGNFPFVQCMQCLSAIFFEVGSVLRLFFLAVVPVFSTSKTPVYFDFIVTKKLYSFFITSGSK